MNDENEEKPEILDKLGLQGRREIAVYLESVDATTRHVVFSDAVTTITIAKTGHGPRKCQCLDLPLAHAHAENAMLVTPFGLHFFPPMIQVPGQDKAFLVMTESKQYSIKDIGLISLPYREPKDGDVSWRANDVVIHFNDLEFVWLQTREGMRSLVTEVLSDTYLSLMGHPVEVHQPECVDLAWQLVGLGKDMTIAQMLENFRKEAAARMRSVTMHGPLLYAHARAPDGGQSEENKTPYSRKYVALTSTDRIYVLSSFEELEDWRVPDKGDDKNFGGERRASYALPTPSHGERATSPDAMTILELANCTVYWTAHGFNIQEISRSAKKKKKAAVGMFHYFLCSAGNKSDVVLWVSRLERALLNRGVQGVQSDLTPAAAKESQRSAKPANAKPAKPGKKPKDPEQKSSASASDTDDRPPKPVRTASDRKPVVRQNTTPNSPTPSSAQSSKNSKKHSHRTHTSLPTSPLRAPDSPLSCPTSPTTLASSPSVANFYKEELEGKVVLPELNLPPPLPMLDPPPPDDDDLEEPPLSSRPRSILPPHALEKSKSEPNLTEPQHQKPALTQALAASESSARIALECVNRHRMFEQKTALPQQVESDPLEVELEPLPPNWWEGEYFLPVIPQSEWQPDESAPCCTACETPFKSHGRHHCRSCGQVYCDPCSPFVGFSLHDKSMLKFRACAACVATVIACARKVNSDRKDRLKRVFVEKVQAAGGRINEPISPVTGLPGRHCLVPNCTEDHTKHYCKHCKDKNSKHFSSGCPSRLSGKFK